MTRVTKKQKLTKRSFFEIVFRSPEKRKNICNDLTERTSKPLYDLMARYKVTLQIFRANKSFVNFSASKLTFSLVIVIQNLLGLPSALLILTSGSKTHCDFSVCFSLILIGMNTWRKALIQLQGNLFALSYKSIFSLEYVSPL